jgi:hypothetical protein
MEVGFDPLEVLGLKTLLRDVEELAKLDLAILVVIKLLNHRDQLVVVRNQA